MSRSYGGVGRPIIARTIGQGGQAGIGSRAYYEDQLPTANLLGYYYLDEASGSTATDQSDNGYNGTILGTPAGYRADGIPGSNTDGAMRFDSDSRVRLEVAPGSLFQCAQFTAMCWFYRLGNGGTTTGGNNTPSAIEPLVTKGRGESEGSNKDCGFFLGVDRDSGVGLSGFYEEGNGTGHEILGGTALSNNTWYHGAFTYDGSHMRLYLNGVEDADAIAEANGPEDTSLQLACIAGALTSAGTNQGWFNGRIAHASVHSAALSSAQILNLYNIGSV